MSNTRPQLAGKASQDTLASMLELEPMPMPDSPLPTPPAAADVETDKELPPLSSEGSDDAEADAGAGVSSSAKHGHSRSVSATMKGTTAALGLSQGHGAVYYLSRIQRYSSYAFTIFSSVHLATTSLIPLATRSVPASESYLLLAREIYQTRLSEPLLVFLPIAAHVAAGVGLRLVRRSQNARRYGRTTASNWPPFSVIAASGYGFAVAVGAHVFLNRLLPIAVQGDSSDIGLAYVAHGFARHPVVSWLSYGAFLAAASGHMVWGWARWLGIAQRAAWSSPDLLRGGDRDVSAGGGAREPKALQKRRRRTWLAVQGGVLLAFCLWASGGLGVVARGGPVQGWVAKVYDELYAKALVL
ncbi:hypothetical protein SPBR_05110 [Sporothrix brasiliensis 5110]|uniref:Mitochondrial adapter protein MCP1 transmembrane domain-containing protein n=1 Tax=Sporothrix brasiliensis 5110 TaxID=1398154 RepID=A0A0C2IRP9_9PEZI|nr:uncharacterized protein SPBR_05110 [Sporothrix brasiliensis 5110]KIH87652.1 hypothetical protein SPBR_05110 [Sporothrix brasiliensis 5110]